MMNKRVNLLKEILMHKKHFSISQILIRFDYEQRKKRPHSIDSISWLDICLIEHEIFHYMVNAIEGFWFIFIVCLCVCVCMGHKIDDSRF